MLMNIFDQKNFTFPYRDIKFPGQHSEEKILFATREGDVIIAFRILFVLTVYLILALALLVFGSVLTQYLPQAQIYIILLALFIIPTSLFSIWWVYHLWKKSVFIITTRRLTKFIATTPWTRYQLSLTLDKIVDTGAYQKGYFQAITRLGYFVARSAAGNIKNFKIINIGFAEDLHNYVNKLLFTFQNLPHQVDSFRPFVPHLKGEARKKFVRSITPEYYQEN